MALQCDNMVYNNYLLTPMNMLIRGGMPTGHTVIIIP